MYARASEPSPSSSPVVVVVAVAIAVAVAVTVAERLDIKFASEYEGENRLSDQSSLARTELRKLDAIVAGAARSRRRFVF